MFGIASKKHRSSISAIAFSADGEFCVTGASNKNCDALIWKTSSPLVFAGRLTGHKAGISSAAWSPKGDLIATGGNRAAGMRNWVEDHKIRLWDVKSNTEIGKLGGDLWIVGGLAFSPDQQLLLSGDNNSDAAGLRLWDVKGLREVARLGIHPFGVGMVAFSPDGQLVASGRRDSQRPFNFYRGDEDKFYKRTIRLFEVKTGLEIDAVQHFGTITSLRFCEDGKKLFSYGTGTFLWDLSSGTKTEFRAGTRYLNSADISLDGEYVAFGCGDKEGTVSSFLDCGVRLFNTRSQSVVGTWPHRFPVVKVAISPKRDSIVAGEFFGTLEPHSIP